MRKLFINNWVCKFLIIPLLNSLFFERGTQLGSRCSGYRVYPDGAYCYGCSDCKE
jgi:hypothetical protein